MAMTKEFLLHIAEYVGKKDGFLDLPKYWKDIEPFLIKYADTYRMWPLGTSLEVAKEAIEVCTYMAVFRTLKGMKTVLKSVNKDFDDAFLTKQSGTGIDPCIILQKGIVQYPEEKEYLRNIITLNIDREELVMFRIDVIESVRGDLQWASSNGGRPKGK
jgi:hypothetical protein